MVGNHLEAVLNCGCCGSACCSPRCEPLEVVSDGFNLIEVPGSCNNPIPEELDVTITATVRDISPTPIPYTCFNGSGTIRFLTPLSYPNGTFCWEGDISGSCTDCNSNTFNWTVRIVLCCDDVTGNHVVSLQPGPSMLCPAFGLTGVNDTYSCNPFRVTGCFPEFGGCFVCLPPQISPFFTICYDITEP